MTEPKFIPKTIPKEILNRSFVANNGEVGFFPEDVNLLWSFCISEKYAILGWETWVIDHVIEVNNLLRKAKGNWSGSVPNTRFPNLLAVIHGECPSIEKNETWDQFVLRTIETAKRTIKTNFDLKDIQEPFHPFIRINISFVSEKEYNEL